MAEEGNQDPANDGKDGPEGAENNTEAATPAAPDPESFGPPAVASTQEVGEAVVSDWASRHAPPQDAAVRGSFVGARAAGASVAEAQEEAVRGWESSLAAYGLEPTVDTRAAAQLAASMMAKPGETLESLESVESYRARNLESAKSALQDMPVGQRYNQETSVMDAVDRAVRGYENYRGAVEQAAIKADMGALVPEQTISGQYSPAMVQMASGPFAQQVGELTGLINAGVSPEKINSLAEPGVMDVIGTILGAVTAPVTALPDTMTKVAAMTAPNVMDRYAMDRLANPVEALGKFGKLADIGLNLLGPLAAPVKMAVNAIGLANTPQVANFAKAPGDPTYGTQASGESGNLSQVLGQLWQPEKPVQKAEQDPLTNLLPKI